MVNRPNPTRDVVLEAQASFDEEIDKQILLLSNLRTRRNLLSPVFRLPPETLANIFIHGARDHYENSGQFSMQVPSWVHVSYVCRHWRDVALNCPTLWSYHFVASQCWTDEVLARSKQAALKIHIDFHYSQGHWWSKLVEKLMNHADRIQDFRARLPAGVLSNHLPLRAPRLQNLDISAWGGVSHDWLSALIHGETPSICTLKLSECPFSWHMLRPAGLTSLSLFQVPPHSKQDIAEFRTALNHMQDLVELYLHNALARTSDLSSSGTYNSPRTTLHRLARLSVSDPLSTVVAFLSCIVLPLKTKVRLEFECELGHDFSIDDYTLIPSALAQRFDVSEDLALSSPTIRSLAVQSGLRLAFIFGSPEPDSDPPFPEEHSGDWNPHIPLKITVSRGVSIMENDWERVIGDICCSAPSTNIQNLHVLDPPFSPVFWRRMLGHFQGLRYLKLSDGNMPDLASVLSVPADDFADPGNKTSPNHILAPVLEKLELLYISFSRESYPARIAISECSLRRALSSRDALRDGLIITECGVDYDDESDADSWHGDQPPVYYGDSSDELEYYHSQFVEWN